MLSEPPYILYYKKPVVICKVKGIWLQIQKTSSFLPQTQKASNQNNAQLIEITKLFEEHGLLATQIDGIWYRRLLPNIKHFVKTLRIRGLGAKTIYKLCDNGAVNSISDLYRIPWIRFHVCLGVKLHSPIVEKIRANIQQTKKAPWPLFLQALNIPGVTAKNIQSIAEIIPDLSTLIRPNSDLLKNRLNARVAENLINWVNKNQKILKELKEIGIG